MRHTSLVAAPHTHGLSFMTGAVEAATEESAMLPAQSDSLASIDRSEKENAPLSSSMTGAELKLRVAVEEICAAGVFEACHKSVSASELAQLEADGGCSAYGDTDVDLALYCAVELLGRPITSKDVFFDLGSGDGRLVLCVALLTDARRSVGVELCPTRHSQAMLAKAEADRRGLLDSRGEVELCCVSMLEHALQDATLVFSYNLPEPGGPFLYAMKAHLLHVLQPGAAILLRGQVLPAQADDTFLADRTSWAVQLFAPCDGGDEPSPGRHGVSMDGAHAAAARVRFRWIQPVIETNVTNRMFQTVGYRLVEEEATLLMGDGDLQDERPLPVAVDEFTSEALRNEPRLGVAIQAWIDAAVRTSQDPMSDFYGPRILELSERRERLGDSPFERSVYEHDLDADEVPMGIASCLDVWTL